ncbi:MAG: NAD-dependent epimerase/dehydratase family protein [Chloroflexota bacterium]|nr:NAD-dependent epimerase/dehydratase family protein [Chloroflexota bacterium]
MTATLVTGGLGYLGRYLVRALAGRGESVVSYNRDFVDSTEPHVRYVQGELYDLPRLVDTLRQNDVNRIIHTAAMSHPELSIDLPITTFTANVDGTLHVLEAARMTKVRRFINFSSECAYGNNEGGLVREDAPLRPTTPYGITKVTTEMLGRVYTDIYGLDVISLRPAELYGPGNRMPQYLREMIRAGLNGTPYRMDKGAAHLFHFVQVADVARATVLAADVAKPAQRIYNVTGGPQTSLGRAAEIVREAIPRADISIGPGFIDSLDRNGPFDISAAERDLGYRPSCTVEEGIRSYVEWLRTNAY